MSQQNWIKPKEKLPDENEKILVKLKHSGVCILTYGRWMENAFSEEVAAWMHIPEYRENENA